MSAFLDKALSVVRALPNDEQDEIARAMLSLASDHSDHEDVEPIDPDHLQAVLDAIEEAKRGEYAPPGVAETVLARFKR